VLKPALKAACRRAAGGARRPAPDRRQRGASLVLPAQVRELGCVNGRHQGRRKDRPHLGPINIALHSSASYAGHDSVAASD
jgi:hypothetical protein